ncbi:hypothetical protein Q5P01_002963 [Channa striata]|uniref:Ig-like domain-containing protein n=1 Tax=Channa striata TaxID=64152 RepID=A0AA88NS13_CHASR|nr:hypothetical protein Q5P01_002963 [Channa striata]
MRPVVSVLLGRVSVLLLVVASSSSGDQLIITAHVGQNVTLPCQAPSTLPIRAAEWSRPDLDPEYVFFYRDGQPDNTNQHLSFENRVELVDSQMKGGNLSVTLKKAISSDTGTYECRVIQQTPARMTRAVIRSEPISIVKLAVKESRDTAEPRGDGQRKAGQVGLLMFVTFACGVFNLG